MHDCLIAIGSNQGDRRALFDAVCERLDQTDGLSRIQASRPLETQAVGGPDHQDGFLNGAIRMQCGLTPQELHQVLVRMESDSGRVRRIRWGPRTLDLDLLLYGREQLDSPDLIVPHPRMSFRRFVLEPAMEIAADMIHPPSGQTIVQLVDRLNSARNQVLCVVSRQREQFANTMLEQVRRQSDAGWDLSVVCQLGAYRELAKTAKLVAYFHDPANGDELPGSGRESEEVEMEARAFAGPTLRLPRDPKQAHIELVAAISAMAPLSPSGN